MTDENANAHLYKLSLDCMKYGRKYYFELLGEGKKYLMGFNIEGEDDEYSRIALSEAFLRLADLARTVEVEDGSKKETK